MLGVEPLGKYTVFYIQCYGFINVGNKLHQMHKSGIVVNANILVWALNGVMMTFAYI